MDERRIRCSWDGRQYHTWVAQFLKDHQETSMKQNRKEAMGTSQESQHHGVVLMNFSCLKHKHSRAMCPQLQHLLFIYDTTRNCRYPLYARRILPLNTNFARTIHECNIKGHVSSLSIGHHHLSIVSRRRRGWSWYRRSGVHRWWANSVQKMGMNNWPSGLILLGGPLLLCTHEGRLWSRIFSYQKFTANVEFYVCNLGQMRGETALPRQYSGDNVPEQFTLTFSPAAFVIMNSTMRFNGNISWNF